jgi:hypothetical protein
VIEAGRNADDIPYKLLQLERAIVILCAKAALQHRWPGVEPTEVVGAAVLALADPLTADHHDAVLKELDPSHKFATALTHVRKLHAAGRLYLLNAHATPQATSVREVRTALLRLQAIVSKQAAQAETQAAISENLMAMSERLMAMATAQAEAQAAMAQSLQAIATAQLQAQAAPAPAQSAAQAGDGV